MKRNLIAFSIMLVMLGACSGQKENRQQDESAADSTQIADSAAAESSADNLADIPMPKAADELFDDFIFNFCASRKLQMERVVFPLPSVNGQEKTAIEKRQWKMEHFFMEQGYYTLIFDNERHMEVVKDTSVHHAIVQKIFFDRNSVVQYVFNRKRGAWLLTSVETEPISEAPNASFLTFFHQFATDKDFQAHSLGETVHFVGPDPDDDFAQMEGEITPDTWEAFAPELPQDMIYNIIYGEPRKETGSKLFVLRGIANGLELEMSFKKVGEHWKLVKIIT
jgi:hypothetical protein